MAIVQAKINVPDNLMPDIICGKTNLMGLVKASDSKKIKKHLEIVALQDKRATAVGQIGLSLLVVSTITLAAFAGAHSYQVFIRKRIKDFESKLNNYVKAVNEQSLTESIIDDLLVSMDKLLMKSKRTVILKLSTDEFVALINCLCDYTKELAKKNVIDLTDKDLDSEAPFDIFDKFKKNLIVQKSIFQQAA